MKNLCCVMDSSHVDPAEGGGGIEAGGPGLRWKPPKDPECNLTAGREPSASGPLGAGADAQLLSPLAENPADGDRDCSTC